MLALCKRRQCFCIVLSVVKGQHLKVRIREWHTRKETEKNVSEREMDRDRKRHRHRGRKAGRVGEILAVG